MKTLSEERAARLKELSEKLGHPPCLTLCADWNKALITIITYEITTNRVFLTKDDSRVGAKR